MRGYERQKGQRCSWCDVPRGRPSESGRWSGGNTHEEQRDVLLCVLLRLHSDSDAVVVDVGVAVVIALLRGASRSSHNDERNHNGSDDNANDRKC